MTARANPKPTDAPAVVVFGRDEAGKAHASWFDQAEAKLAEKAAGLMGLRLLPISTDPEHALAAKVPKGRVFATGKAFAVCQSGAVPRPPVGGAEQRGQTAEALNRPDGERGS